MGIIDKAINAAHINDVKGRVSHNCYSSPYAYHIPSKSNTESSTGNVHPNAIQETDESIHSDYCILSSLFPRMCVRNTMFTKSNSFKEITSPSTMLNNEIRYIAHRVFHSNYCNDLTRSVAITGIKPSEGVSTISLALSLLVATEQHRPVFLIDSSINSSKSLSDYSMHDNPKHDNPNAYGLTDFLARRINQQDFFANCIRCKDIPLILIPRGTIDSSSAGLISGTEMQNLISMLSSLVSDSIVIIDTPPILSCSASVAISEFVDKLAIVADASTTTASLIETALSVLIPFTQGSQDVSIQRQKYLSKIGFILNNTNPHDSTGKFMYCH